MHPKIIVINALRLWDLLTMFNEGYKHSSIAMFLYCYFWTLGLPLAYRASRISPNSMFISSKPQTLNHPKPNLETKINPVTGSGTGGTGDSAFVKPAPVPNMQTARRKIAAKTTPQLLAQPGAPPAKKPTVSPPPSLASSMPPKAAKSNSSE